MDNKPMTPEQRAEHIVTELDCDSCQYSHERRQATTVYIAEQIRVAEDAAYRRGVEDATGKQEKSSCGHEADCNCLKERWQKEEREAIIAITQGYGDIGREIEGLIRARTVEPHKPGEEKI